MTNRRFATYMLSIPVVAGLLVAMVADAGAAEPNHPSAARAKLALAGAPMACVVRTVIAADGSLHRVSRCEAVQPGFSSCMRQPLLNGRAGETVLACKVASK